MRNLWFTISSIFSGMEVLFISLFLMMLGAGLQGSLLGIRGDNEGFSTQMLAMISSGYYVGFFAGSIIVPNLLKRVGYIRVFAALIAISSVAAVAYAMFVDQYLWFIMRVLTGFCFSGIYMIAESWLNLQTHNDNRAKVMGTYVIVLFIGMSAGQLFLNFGDINGYYLFAMASVIISLASVPLLLAKRPAPLVAESTTTLSLLSLYKRSPFGAVASFAANFINGAVVGMAAIYAKTIGMPTEKIALFVASAFIGVVVFQFPIGYLSDRVDRRKAIIGLFFLSAVLATLAIIATDYTTVLILLFALLGGVALPLYGLCIAYVNDRLHPEEVLPATTALIKISGIANMIAPVIVGYLMTRIGNEWFFGTTVVAAVSAMLFGIYRLYKGRDIIIEEQGDFAHIGVAATPATLTLAHEGIQLEFDFGEAHQKSPQNPS
ncbi:MAG: hypothetical protein CR977_00440 [Gammaproteobacteria bacterium]|nr:MAG: hypothetical protein CR977_00440 [Gammaproteobacteria bacterium]